MIWAGSLGITMRTAKMSNGDEDERQQENEDSFEQISVAIFSERKGLKFQRNILRP